MKKVSREKEKKIMRRIRKAGDPDNYETSWDEQGAFTSKEKTKIKSGGKSRASGSQFELKVRKDLESQGRIVDKWTNNIDLDKGKIIISRKYNPFKKMLIIGTGFPDFVSIKHVHDELYSVIGVEVKMNGTLSKIEKEKCRWYLKNKVFSGIWIAKKGAPKGVPRDIFKKMSTRGIKRGHIEYVDFEERYGN